MPEMILAVWRAQGGALRSDANLLNSARRLCYRFAARLQNASEKSAPEITNTEETT